MYVRCIFTCALLMRYHNKPTNVPGWSGDEESRRSCSINNSPNANNKFVLKLPAKVSDKYKRSPHYNRCKHWDDLPQKTQNSFFLDKFKTI